MGLAKARMAKDLSVWLKASSYTLAQAALILLKEHPGDWPETEELLINHPKDFSIIYNELIEHANACVCRGITSIEDMQGAYIIDDKETQAPSIFTGFRLHTNRDWLGADITKEAALNIRVGSLEIQNWAKQQDNVRIMDGESPLYQHLYAAPIQLSDTPKGLQQIKDAIDGKYPGEALSIPHGGKKKIKGSLCPPMTGNEFEKYWREGTGRGIFKTKSHEAYGKKECRK